MATLIKELVTSVYGNVRRVIPSMLGIDGIAIIATESTLRHAVELKNNAFTTVSAFLYRTLLYRLVSFKIVNKENSDSDLHKGNVH